MLLSSCFRIRSWNTIVSRHKPHAALSQGGIIILLKSNASFPLEIIPLQNLTFSYFRDLAPGKVNSAGYSGGALAVINIHS